MCVILILAACGRFLCIEIIGQLKHLCTALSMNAPSYHQQETGLIHHRLHSKMADTFLNIQVQTSVVTATNYMREVGQ